METFAATPQSPTDAAPAVPGHQQRENMLRSVKRFEESVARWRADMLIVQQGLAHMYEDLSALPNSTAINDQLAMPDEFIEHVDNEVESERLALEQSRFSNKQVIATIMKTSSDNAHFTKKLLKRLYEAGVAQHNARVDFFIFFLCKERSVIRITGEVRPSTTRKIRSPTSTSMLADRAGADHADEGLPEGLCKIDFGRSGSGRYCIETVYCEPAPSGVALRKIQNVSYPARRPGPLACRHS
jgi:hypothetical protein